MQAEHLELLVFPEDPDQLDQRGLQVLLEQLEALDLLAQSEQLATTV